MAKKIRFPLKMKSGAEVRSLEELQENFDLESVLRYFADGRLKTWLADRYYNEKAEAVSALSVGMPDLNAQLCDILGIEYISDDDETDLELIQRRNEKLKILNEITADKDILDNIDLVAMDQDELFDILDESPEKVYLYGDKFEIPFGENKIRYIGVNKPLVILENGKKKFDYEEVGIIFENIEFEEKMDSDITIDDIIFGCSLKEIYDNTDNCELKSKAESGDDIAAFNLAYQYENGFNVEKDYKKALAWYIKASSQGNASASYKIAEFYSKGLGVVKNGETAEIWYKKAVQQGYPEWRIKNLKNNKTEQRQSNDRVENSLFSQRMKSVVKMLEKYKK